MVTIKYTQRFNKDSFEKQFWAQNQVICGIDEVGRGCIAGPVLVAACILHPGKKSPLLKDSKITTLEEREKAYAWLQKHSWHAVALVDHATIDSHNIYRSTLAAMKRAFLQLMATCPIKPHAALIDAMPLKLAGTAYEELPVYHFPFGERKSSSIAAASIIAKVTRDRLMSHFDSSFKEYDLASSKGYATPLHKKQVRLKGHSIIHRINFLEGWGLLNDEESAEQHTIFTTGDSNETIR